MAVYLLDLEQNLSATRYLTIWQIENVVFHVRSRIRKECVKEGIFSDESRYFRNGLIIVLSHEWKQS